MDINVLNFATAFELLFLITVLSKVHFRKQALVKNNPVGISLPDDLSILTFPKGPAETKPW